MGEQGMHEDEFTEEGDDRARSARADVLINLHTVVFDTLHVEPLNSVHGREVLDEIIKLIEEKVITVDMAEEIILKNGPPAGHVQ